MANRIVEAMYSHQNQSGSSSHCVDSARSGVKCHHDLDAKLRVVRKSPNYGEKFYSCPRWPKGDCSFFMWEKERGVPECDHFQLKLANLEKLVDELLKHKTKMEDQLKILETNSEINALRF